MLSMLNDAVYTVDDGPVQGAAANPRFNGPPSSQTIGDLVEHREIGPASGLNYNSTGSLPLIVLAVLISSIGGFLIGYRISKWRILSKLTRNAHSSSGSSASSGASDDYGHVYAPSVVTRNRLSRAPSIIQSTAGGKSLAIEHIYSQAPATKSSASTAGDAVSLVFGHGPPQHFVPMPMLTSVSNGGSGMATPRHDARTLMLMNNNNNNNGQTLPRDYKVKKVYL